MAPDIRQQLARIDQKLAEHDRKRQAIQLAPWAFALIGLGAGAALFAAGMAYMRLFA